MMVKDFLEYLVNQNLSIREIASKCGKSQTSIRYWLNKYSLKTNVLYNNFQCKYCGENDPENFYAKKNRCKKCHNLAQSQYTKNLKKQAVEYKGGKCERCGYNKNYAALDFHHLDPNEKDTNWKTSRHWKWEKLRKEIDKCVLVCKNCHAEIHYQDCFIDLTKR